MKICGPRFAICGLVLSAWGIIQLLLMGLFFYMKAVALIEDVKLPEGKKHATPEEFYMDIKRGFNANAFNCWIAACIYVLTFLFSGHQYYLNSRSSLAV